MKWSLNNLSDEDKRKYIVYAIFGIVCFIVFGVAYSFSNSSNETNKEVSTLDVPLSSEKEQYENRLQALQKFDTVKADPNQRMTQFFSSKPKDAIDENMDYFNEQKSQSVAYTDYETIEQNVNNRSTSASKGTKASNYNKYGNASMWTVEEPENNSIGYSSTQNTRDYIEKRKKELEQPQDIEIEVNRSSTQVTTVAPSKKALFENGKQSNNGTIKAVVRGTQEIKDGQTLRFQTNEDGMVNGIKIPRNTSLFGIVRFNQYRAEITIETANINGNIHSINLIVYSPDGLKGIPISTDEHLKQGRNSAVQEVANKTGIVGKAGSIIGGVVSSKARETSVKFIDNHKVLLIQKG